jgi:hypothetical protein
MGTSPDSENCYCCGAALPSAGGSCLICATQSGASIALTGYLLFEQACRVGLGVEAALGGARHRRNSARDSR